MDIDISDIDLWCMQDIKPGRTGPLLVDLGRFDSTKSAKFSNVEFSVWVEALSWIPSLCDFLCLLLNIFWPKFDNPKIPQDNYKQLLIYFVFLRKKNLWYAFQSRNKSIKFNSVVMEIHVANWEFGTITILKTYLEPRLLSPVTKVYCWKE